MGDCAEEGEEKALKGYRHHLHQRAKEEKVKTDEGDCHLRPREMKKVVKVVEGSHQQRQKGQKEGEALLCWRLRGEGHPPLSLNTS